MHFQQSDSLGYSWLASSLSTFSLPLTDTGSTSSALSCMSSLVTPEQQVNSLPHTAFDKSLHGVLVCKTDHWYLNVKLFLTFITSVLKATNRHVSLGSHFNVYSI